MSTMPNNDVKLLKVVAGRSGSPTIRRDLDSVKQCDWVRRNGTDGYLCCILLRGHEGLHEDHSEDFWRRLAAKDGKAYKAPEVWWYPLKEWERNFGAAARACYGDLNYSVGYK